MTDTDDHAPPRHWRLTVNPDYAGVRLDKWLSEMIPDLTRTRIKALIEEGALSRNGTACFEVALKVEAGDHYTLVAPRILPAKPKAEPIALDIRYEDADVIVINKPAGMVVHPAAGALTGTLVNALIAHCGASLSGIGGVARPGVVHRLDKDTSGLIVAAKHDAAHRALSTAFSVHDVERVYVAIAHGALRPAVGVINAPIARAGGDRKKMAVVDPDAGRSDARCAITHYRLLEAYGRGRARLAGDALASLLECRLETGRTHQIRVHLASIGRPLIGDPVYGRRHGLTGLRPGDPAADRAIEALGRFRRQALHAQILGFDHPRTGERLHFEAEPPEDFLTLKAALAAL